jgi:hypothetical protein
MLGGVGKVPGNGHPYPISLRFALETKYFPNFLTDLLNRLVNVVLCI